MDLGLGFEVGGGDEMVGLRGGGGAESALRVSRWRVTLLKPRSRWLRMGGGAETAAFSQASEAFREAAWRFRFLPFLPLGVTRSARYCLIGASKEIRRSAMVS